MKMKILKLIVLLLFFQHSYAQSNKNNLKESVTDLYFSDGDLSKTFIGKIYYIKDNSGNVIVSKCKLEEHELYGNRTTDDSNFIRFKDEYSRANYGSYQLGEDNYMVDDYSTVNCYQIKISSKTTENFKGFGFGYFRIP
jgi:hypothetical protein